MLFKSVGTWGGITDRFVDLLKSGWHWLVFRKQGNYLNEKAAEHYTETGGQIITLLKKKWKYTQWVNVTIRIQVKQETPEITRRKAMVIRIDDVTRWQVSSRSTDSLDCWLSIWSESAADHRVLRTQNTSLKYYWHINQLNPTAIH